jgi:hypothetical protein
MTKVLERGVSYIRKPEGEIKLIQLWYQFSIPNQIKGCPPRGGAHHVI